MNKKTILISGASKGIGLCCAKGLKARGYEVFATARLPADVQALNEAGLHGIVLDLNDSHSIQSAVKIVLEKTNNNLYALFNNAGFGQPGAVEDLNREAIRKQFETNLFGPIELTNHIIPIMRRQGYGRIINMGSILGIVSLSYRGAYNASKHALEAFTDTLRLELYGSNIHISLIEPGPIHSNFRNSAFSNIHNLDIAKSPHKSAYDAILSQYDPHNPSEWFNNNKLEKRFVKNPDAVLPKLIHALESTRPKSRYYVTVPAHLLAILKRTLPTFMLDKILRGSSM